MPNSPPLLGVTVPYSVNVGQRERAAALGQRERRSWHRERGRGKGRISLRLFFLDRNNYIAHLLIVL